MVTLLSRYPRRNGGSEATGRLELPFERRQKSRQRACLESGEEVTVDLPRGQVLRGGDCLVATDGRVIEVVAKPERVVNVTCGSPSALARAAYHLGNRHVAVQVGDGWLRIAADPVLERMLEGLGASLSYVESAFEPEAGAYGGHHRHDNESGHGGRIHEFGGSPHAHPHPHEHGDE